MSASPPTADVAGPSATAPSTTTAPTAPPSPPKVHPLARKLAGLLSDMSLRDQHEAAVWHERIIYGALVVSYPIAYMFGNVLISVASVVAAGALCLALFLPNWHQRKDTALRWADDTAVYHFHQQLAAARLVAKDVTPTDLSNKDKTE